MSYLIKKNKCKRTAGIFNHKSNKLRNTSDSSHDIAGNTDKEQTLYSSLFICTLYK